MEWIWRFLGWIAAARATSTDDADQNVINEK